VAETKRWYQTTAIDYPNSRPHIGTAFEKLGADVQARYRRMEGYDVFFLMGNDENTTKVADRAKALNRDVQEYCDDMATQFKEVWKALDISFDAFEQTSHARHKAACAKFIQKVYDNGHIYKDEYAGWYCNDCEEFKSDKLHTENAGDCPVHKKPLVRRSEPCWLFRLSSFTGQLLAFYAEHPDFIQPESRKNEIIGLIQAEGLRDINISRLGESWGIPIPFDPEFTIYVWFDALLTYISGIGYGDDESMFAKYWPADLHFIGKDITRFHVALWPAMCWAAGIEPPRKVFGHGFVTFAGDKIGKSRTEELKAKGLDYLLEPMTIIEKFSAEGFRYYFLRECPYPGDGEISPDQFIKVFNTDLSNKLGNLLSRCLTVGATNFGGVFDGTAGTTPAPVSAEFEAAKVVDVVRGHVESCSYNLALDVIIQNVVTPANQFLDLNAPWKLVKTGEPADKERAKGVIVQAVEHLRIAAILLKPFLPNSAKTIYESFAFDVPWNAVTYADAAARIPFATDLRITAQLIEGKPKVLFPRIAG